MYTCSDERRPTKRSLWLHMMQVAELLMMKLIPSVSKDKGELELADVARAVCVCGMQHCLLLNLARGIRDRGLRFQTLLYFSGAHLDQGTCEYEFRFGNLLCFFGATGSGCW